MRGGKAAERSVIHTAWMRATMPRSVGRARRGWRSAHRCTTAGRCRGGSCSATPWAATACAGSCSSRASRQAVRYQPRHLMRRAMRCAMATGSALGASRTARTEVSALCARTD